MMIIILRFMLPLIISSFLLYISENKKIMLYGKKINKLITGFALVIPMLVAGTRNMINVGDSTLYGNIIFKFSQNTTWNIYYDYFHNNYFAFETLYLLVSFLISKVTTNYHILFFILSTMNVLLIYFGLKKLKNYIKIDIWFGMFVFYFLFFGQTLNIIRQSLGLAIVFWGFNFIYEKKFFKYIVTVIIASLFHISSFIGIVFYFLYWIIDRIKHKKFFVILLTCCSLFVVLFYAKIFYMLSLTNLLPSKFYSLYYITSIPISPFAIATKGSILIVFLVLLYSEKIDKKDKWFYLAMLFLDLIISQLAGANEYLYRLALMFGYTKNIFFSIDYNKKLRVILFGYCLLYFYMEYIYQGALPISTFL